MSPSQSSPPPFSSYTRRLLSDTGRFLGIPAKECAAFSRLGQFQLGPLTFSIVCKKTERREPSWLITSQSRPASLNQQRWLQALLRATMTAQVCGQWAFATDGDDLGALYCALDPDQSYPELVSANLLGAMQFWSDLIDGAHKQECAQTIPSNSNASDCTDPHAELEAPRAVRVLIAEALLELGFDADKAHQGAQRGQFFLDQHPVFLTMAVDSPTLLLLSPLLVSHTHRPLLSRLLCLNSVMFPSLGIAAAASPAGLQLLNRWPLEPRQPIALARWLRSFAHYARDLSQSN